MLQAAAIAEELLKTEYDAVRLVFNRFVSAIAFKPTIATILSPDVSIRGGHAASWAAVRQLFPLPCRKCHRVALPAVQATFRGRCCHHAGALQALGCRPVAETTMTALSHVAVQAAELHRLAAETAAAITTWLWRQD